MRAIGGAARPSVPSASSGSSRNNGPPLAGAASFLDFMDGVCALDQKFVRAVVAAPAVLVTTAWNALIWLVSPSTGKTAFNSNVPPAAF